MFVVELVNNDKIEPTYKVVHVPYWCAFRDKKESVSSQERGTVGFELAPC